MKLTGSEQGRCVLFDAVRSKTNKANTGNCVFSWSRADPFNGHVCQNRHTILEW